MIVRIVIAAVAFVLALIAARNALASTRVMTRRVDEPEDVVALVRRFEDVFHRLNR